ncbi:MAG: CRISPR-associated endonuclease Cas1 [bacterium]|nr:CRISPR-associated endonuclease Cas1 [bacterium]
MLILDDFGCHVYKKHKRLVVVNKKAGYKKEVALKKLRTVLVLTRLSLTSELLKELADNGITVLLAGYLGRPVAKIQGARVGGTPANRKLQYEALKNYRSVELVKELIKAKIENQLTNIKYYAKSKRIYGSAEVHEIIHKILALIDRLLTISCPEGIEKVRQEILNIEGLAANEYFSFLAKLYGGLLGFTGRDQEGKDMFNLLLNVGYNLLALWTWNFVDHFSLDAFEGFLHVERPGRLSLVYDLMEPLRPFVDRFVLSFMLQRQLHGELPEKRKYEEVAQFKKYFVQCLLDYRVQYGRRKVSLRHALFLEIESVVSFLQGKGRIYTPRLVW